MGPNFFLNHSDKVPFNVCKILTLTYKVHVIHISLTVGTPLSRASVDDFMALCPSVRC